MTEQVRDVDELPSDRAQLLLRTLIECYIRGGEPVGSRTLSRESGLSLSAATIRNVMADLEEHGFVSSPHTSAGRVPTDKGYRFFVNTMLRYQPPDRAEIAALRRKLELRAGDPKALVTAASQLVSSLTHLAGVVTVPRETHAALSQIEFVGLSGNRVLVILV
ncbi:MAG: heat-inducible transcriptional repressor HrcA, partial [Dongiaceae bacterium]